MPSFLNFIFEFRSREEPHTQTSFCSEVSLSKKHPRQSFPSLSRSGFRTQHCFNLIGIERDDAAVPDDPNPWRIRQTAAYHSFDVATSRSIFIFLKGNDRIRQRLVTETEKYCRIQPDYPESVAGCFLANLRSHMLVFTWCLENWSEYIDHFEQKSARFTTVANYTDVTEATDDEPIKRKLEKHGTWNSIVSRQRTGTWNSSSPTLPASPISEKLAGFFRPRTDSNLSTPKSGAQNGPNGTSLPATTNPKGDVDLDREFSFEKLQSLRRMGVEIHKVMDILGQNHGVLGDISQHFHQLLAFPSFNEFVDLGEYEEEIADFFGGLESLRRAFQNLETRLRSLHLKVEKDAVLVCFNP